VSPGVTPVAAEVVDTRASDHRPVVADLEVPDHEVADLEVADRRDGR